MINAAANDRAAVRDMLNSLPSVTLRTVGAQNAATGTGLLADRSAGLQCGRGAEVNKLSARIRSLSFG
jgi:hypothetical protein